MMTETKTDTLYIFEEDGTEYLRIEKENQNIYHIHNFDTDMTVKVKLIDDYTTNIICLEHKRKGKNGRFYKSTRLIEHNLRWADYILEKVGFIRKKKCIDD